MSNDKQHLFEYSELDTNTTATKGYFIQMKIATLEWSNNSSAVAILHT
jgi:hypothetical protein